MIQSHNFQKQLLLLYQKFLIFKCCHWLWVKMSIQSLTLPIKWIWCQYNHWIYGHNVRAVVDTVSTKSLKFGAKAKIRWVSSKYLWENKKLRKCFSLFKNGPWGEFLRYQKRSWKSCDTVPLRYHQVLVIIKWEYLLHTLPMSSWNSQLDYQSCLFSEPELGYKIGSWITKVASLQNQN